MGRQCKLAVARHARGLRFEGELGTRQGRRRLARLQLRRRRLWDDCFVFGGYRFRSECFSTSDFGNEYEKVPSCGLFNVGVQYSPTFRNLDGLVVTFTVDNLFDKDYCDYTTYGRNYWPAAGRSYMLSVRYEF